jgi:hypothetical protein
MNTSGITNVVERHGCLVCAKIFEVLAVHAPDGSLLACTVTSPGGRVVPDDRQPLVACDSHTAAEVDHAYKNWKHRNSSKSDYEQDGE